MVRILDWINRFVWGAPALLLILGVGMYLSIRTGFIQLRLLPTAIKDFFGKFKGDCGADGVSSFQALCTALAATVGTGNIAGVAGAIALGGPGSIFWMWVCAFLGMVTKYAEAVLAVKYRQVLPDGTVLSGPMYIISKGMGKKWRWMAVCYCFFGVVAAFGIGNATQINAVIDCVHESAAWMGIQELDLMDLLLGCVFAGLAAVSLLGGAKRIGKIAALLVPLASAAYLALGTGALICHSGEIPAAFLSILQGAFSPKAVTGGAIGSVFIALRVGASRGVFTNEAGMGTAAIAHGASRVEHPGEQGLMGIMEVFLDTIVICTMTALVILTSGVEISYGVDSGASLTVRAFASTYGRWVSIPMTIFLCSFAFATMLGWGLYGLRCAGYLLGERSVKCFVFIQAGASVVSVLLETGTVWALSETVNGLMALPNLIALAALSPVTVALTHEHRKRSARKRSDNYLRREERETVTVVPSDS